MRTDRRAEWFAAVERTTELPLLILAVAMVPLLVLPFVLDLSAGVEATFLALDWTIWGIFGLELVVKTYLAPARRSYLRQHWFDVLIVVVPVLRPLRVARSARALRAVRMLRVGAVLARISLTARPILTRHGLQHAVLLSGLLVVVGSIATTLFEHNGGGSIGDFGTALWWALATVTTVGYGDATPETAAGRGVGVMLMFVGIGVFSLLAANVAAYFVEQHAEQVTSQASIPWRTDSTSSRRRSRRCAPTWLAPTATADRPLARPEHAGARHFQPPPVFLTTARPTRDRHESDSAHRVAVGDHRVAVDDRLLQ